MPKTNLVSVPDIFHSEEARELAKSMYLTMSIVRYPTIAQYTGKPAHTIRKWAEDGDWKAIRHAQKEKLKSAIDAEIGDAKRCKIRALKAIEKLQGDLEKRTEDFCNIKGDSRTRKMLIVQWSEIMELQEKLIKQLGIS